MVAVVNQKLLSTKQTNAVQEVIMDRQCSCSISNMIHSKVISLGCGKHQLLFSSTNIKAKLCLCIQTFFRVFRKRRKNLCIIFAVNWSSKLLEGKIKLFHSTRCPPLCWQCLTCKAVAHKVFVVNIKSKQWLHQFSFPKNHCWHSLCVSFFLGRRKIFWEMAQKCSNVFKKKTLYCSCIAF